MHEQRVHILFITTVYYNVFRMQFRGPSTHTHHPPPTHHPIPNPQSRYTHSGSSQPTGQIMHDGGEVQLEAGVCEVVRTDLTARGHHLTRGANGGGYQSITFDAVQKSYIGASEMRKDGHAGGY